MFRRSSSDTSRSSNSSPDARGEPTPSAFARLGGEEGVALAALLLSLTIMLIGLSLAAPSWHYVVQDAKEQELLFRGWRMANALRMHQMDNNRYPDSIDNLIAAKYLPKNLSTNPLA